jgi:hypothetical protein
MIVGMIQLLDRVTKDKFGIVHSFLIAEDIVQ